MRSSVSRVASTAPWPARAWSEWPCVMTALSTARVGSTWNPPGLQHTPAGVGITRSSGRIEPTYVARGRARAFAGFAGLDRARFGDYLWGVTVLERTDAAELPE